MNATKNELIKEFNRAQSSGWLPFFIEAAKKITGGFFDESDLLAIGSRETNLDPKWLRNAGDGGHGYGLLQADVRSFPDWVKSGKWRDAREGILMGARILLMKWTDIELCKGRKSAVWSSKAKKFYEFVGKRVSGAEQQTVTIAAYNSGRWAHYAVSKSQPADAYTTGKDYAKDVQERAAFFRPLFEKWKSANGYSNTTVAVVEPEPAAVSPAVQPSPDNSNAASLKDLGNTVFMHCPKDSVKNIFVVIGTRVLTGVLTVWSLGLHGQIFLIVAALIFFGAFGYALYKYSDRAISGAKRIVEYLF